MAKENDSIYAPETRKAGSGSAVLESKGFAPAGRASKGVATAIQLMELSGNERKALQHMLAFYVKTEEHGSGLKDRLKQFPNGWRDWRLMVSLARKLLGQMYSTLTPRHYQQMKLLERHGECAVIIRPATKAECVEFVHEKALNVVIMRCIDANCSLCMKSDAEVRGCKLRKALFDIKPPMEIPRYGCVYRDIVFNDREKEEMQ